MENKNKLGKKIIELNILNSRIKELEQNLTLLEKQISELQASQLYLDELKNIKKNSEILVPIIPGIFTRAKLLDNSELIVNIGARSLAKKSIDETKELLQKKLNQSIDLHEKLISEINLASTNINKLEEDLKKNN